MIVALALFGPGDGKKKGRRGNALYEQEQYAEAAQLYQEALKDVQAEGQGVVHAGLLNNLGASLFRQGHYEQAVSAFAGSVRMGSDLKDAVRASYNAGNAAAMQQQLETALDAYRSALLCDPDNEDAKFNYEFVKRQLQEQREQSDGNQENQEQNQDRQQNQDQQQNQDENQDRQQNPEQDKQHQNQEPRERQQPNPEQLSEEEAQRILQALENEEEQLLRQIQKMKARPRRVEKDW